MAPIEIRFSLLGVAFGLLGVGMLYHLYSSSLAGHFTSFVLGAAAALGGSSSLMDLRKLLAVVARVPTERAPSATSGTRAIGSPPLS